MKRKVTENIRAEGVKINIDWFSKKQKTISKKKPSTKKPIKIDSLVIGTPNKPMHIWKSKTMTKNCLLKGASHKDKTKLRKFVITSPTNELKRVSTSQRKDSKSIERSLTAEFDPKLLENVSPISAEVDLKIQNLNEYISQNRNRLRTSLSMRKSLLEWRKERPAKHSMFKSKWKPRTPELPGGVLFGSDQKGSMYNGFAGKHRSGGPAPNGLRRGSEMEIQTEMSVRDKLELTGQKNRVLYKSIRQKVKQSTFAEELDKQKKLNATRKFKTVFAKMGTQQKKLLGHLQNGLKIRKLFSSRTRRRLQSKHSPRGSNKENTGTRNSRGKGHLLGVPKSPKNLWSLDSQRKLILPIDFREYTWSFQGLKRHFKHAMTREVLHNFHFAKQFYNEILDREEVWSLKDKVVNFFGCEKSLKRRLHMAVVQGADIAYKLKLVYKEQGELLSLIFEQIAEDVAGFRQNVGKTAYKLVQNNKNEINKAKERFKEREQVFETRLKLLAQKHEKEKKKGKLQDEERILMRKLIYELQEKNEKYARTVERLKNRKETFEKKASVVESNQVRNRFKKIVRKIIPVSPPTRRFSFVGVTKKLKQFHLKSKHKPESKTPLDKDSARDVSIQVKTERDSVTKQYDRMNLKKFSQPVSKKRMLYSSESESSAKKTKTPELSDPNRKVGVYRRGLSKGKSRFMQTLNINGLGRLDVTGSGQPGTCRQCQMRAMGQSSQRRLTQNMFGSERKERMPNHVSQPKRIGLYLLKDIEKVSKFYIVPDGGMNHKATQAGLDYREMSTQTELTLVDRIFDDIMGSQKTFTLLVKDFHFRRSISYQKVLERISVMKKQRRESRADNLGVPSAKYNGVRKSIRKMATDSLVNDVFMNLHRLKSIHSGPRKAGPMRMTIKPPFGEHELDEEEIRSFSNFGTSSQNLVPIKLTKMDSLYRNMHLPVTGAYDAEQRKSEKKKLSILSKSNSQYYHRENFLNRSDDKEQIQKIFDEFLEENLLYEKKDLISRETKLIWVTQYLIQEEGKNSRLAQKNQMYRETNQMLKGMIQIHRKKNHRTKSLQLSREPPFGAPSELDATARRMQRAHSVTQKSSKSKSTQLANFVAQKRASDDSQARKHIFGKASNRGLWAALKMHLISKLNGSKPGDTEGRLHNGRGAEIDGPNGHLEPAETEELARSRPRVPESGLDFRRQVLEAEPRDETAEERDPRAQGVEEVRDGAGRPVQDDQHHSAGVLRDLPRVRPE